MESEEYVFPVSFAQQRLWFLEQLVDGSSSYNLDLALQLDGVLDVDALDRSLQEITRRHEVLRTTFAEIDGEPVQVVASALIVPLREIDLRALPRDEADAEVQRIATRAAQQPFDLAHGPLIRATLVRVAAETNVLLLALHHIVTDGWSMDVLYYELTTLYAAFSAGEPSPLPPLPIQYADFALWQREWLAGEVLAEQVGYWRTQLEGVARLDLPADRPRPALKSYRGAAHFRELHASLAVPLRQLSQREGTTLFMTLLAGFAALLSRYSGQTDIAIGSPIANRTRTELDGLMGFFVNTLVLRTDVSDAPSFRTLLARVRDTALGAYAHQDLPFERLVEELQPQRDLSRNPLFDVMFHVRTAGGGEPLRFDGIRVSSVERTNDTAKFDLSLGLWDLGESFSAQFEYNTDLFDAATIARMADHFETLLLGAVADPDQPVTTLPLLTPRERQQILIHWNDTSAEIPDGTVHSLVEARAAHTPDALAVCAGDASLTYGELNRRANQLAHWLLARGAGREALVAVLLDRSPELIVAVLAILKTGAAYLPLDPDAPPARTNTLIANASVTLMLSRETLPNVASFPDVNPGIAGSPDDLAYVICTSGSTGTPKGVEITHRSLMNLVAWHVRTYEVTASDRASHLAGLAFDASVWDTWPYLASGASLHLADEEARSSPDHILEWLVARAITIAFVPTPLAESMLTARLPRNLALRTLLTGGDVLHRAPSQPLPFVLVNHYGPTETTVVATATPVALDRSSTPPPIGRPIANGEAYILDAHGQPVPAGVPGELYAGGIGIARGYRGRPDLTGERFLPHPFRECARLYRTGDRVRFRADGQIEFLGRIDDQIKLHGVRIEPAEIEAALMRHPAIAEARVVKREDVTDDPRLVAYLVARPVAQTAAADVLSRFLREQLPAQMIPAAYVWLRELPVTRNGKLDRAALPAPGSSRPTLETRYATPQDELERTLAAIWCDVLQLETVGTGDNFFDLGGRSLLLVRVHSQLRRTGSDGVSILDLFRYPTIRSLAAHLRNLSRETH